MYYEALPNIELIAPKLQYLVLQIFASLFSAKNDVFIIYRLIFIVSYTENGFTFINNYQNLLFVEQFQYVLF